MYHVGLLNGRPLDCFSGCAGLYLEAKTQASPEINGTEPTEPQFPWTKKRKKRKREKKACFVMDIYGLYIWHELSSLSDITELRPLSDSISTYKVLIWMRVTVSRGSVMYRQNPQGRYLQNQSTRNFPSYIFSSAITVQWTSIRCKGIKESFGLFLVSVKMYVLLGI